VLLLRLRQLARCPAPGLRVAGRRADPTVCRVAHDVRAHEITALRMSSRCACGRRGEQIMCDVTRSCIRPSRRKRRSLPRQAKTGLSAADPVRCGLTLDISGRELVGDITSQRVTGCITLSPMRTARQTSAPDERLGGATGRGTSWTTSPLLSVRQLSAGPAGSSSDPRKAFVVNASRTGELTVEFRIQGGSAGLVRPPGQSRRRWPRVALMAEGAAVDAGAPLAQTRQQQGPT